MRLTLEKDRKALERYRHVKPARGWGVVSCPARLQGTRRRCTLARGHRGPHVAHRWTGRVVAVWDAAAAGPGARDPGPSAPGRKPGSLTGRRPVGLRSRDAPGPLAWIGERLRRLVTSPEDLALLVLFLAFVGFAIEWLFLIAG